MTALYRDFDAQVDAISATDVDPVGDRGLRGTTTSLRHGTGMLAAAATTGKQERFVAAYYEVRNE